MTLHVVTITPDHILSVSDRLISTSGGQIELDDDRFKHVTLQTEDARAVISFAGFAGMVGRDGKVNETTADWLTTVLADTLKAGYHEIDKHLTDIRDRTNQYLNSLRKDLRPEDLRLAIIVSGWAGADAFNCVMDNCVDKGMKWSTHARDSLTVRIRKYAGDAFPAGCYVVFLCNELIAKRYTDLRRLLQLKAIQGDVEGMFDASVQIIRAVSTDPESNGTVGIKCSGIHLPRNALGFRALHDRVDSRTWTVIPNHVISTSHLKVVHQNDELHRPKPAAKLVYLTTPADADTPRKRLAFWHRAIERLRLLHNEYGAEVRKKGLKYTLRRFHEWQRTTFNPVMDAAQNERNAARLQMQWEEPDKYGIVGTSVDTFVGPNVAFQMLAASSDRSEAEKGPMADPFLTLKIKDRVDTTWDELIDLRDVTPFE